jgi:fibronectin-binding autotransporter adhesin
VRFIGDFIKNPDGTQIHPVLVVRYLHGANDQFTTLNAAFDGAPDVGFAVGGVQPARNHWQGALGASFDLTPQAAVYAYYSVDAATRSTSNAANLGFRWSFSKPAAAAAVGMEAQHMPASTPAVAALGAYPAVAPVAAQSAVSPAAAAVLPVAVAAHPADADGAPVAAAPFGKCKNHIAALGHPKGMHEVHHHPAGNAVVGTGAAPVHHALHPVAAKKTSTVSCSG